MVSAQNIVCNPFSIFLLSLAVFLLIACHVVAVIDGVDDISEKCTNEICVSSPRQRKLEPEEVPNFHHAILTSQTGFEEGRESESFNGRGTSAFYEPNSGRPAKTEPSIFFSLPPDPNVSATAAARAGADEGTEAAAVDRHNLCVV